MIQNTHVNSEERINWLLESLMLKCHWHVILSFYHDLRRMYHLMKYLGQRAVWTENIYAFSHDLTILMSNVLQPTRYHLKSNPKYWSYWLLLFHKNSFSGWNITTFRTTDEVYTISNLESSVLQKAKPFFVLNTQFIVSKYMWYSEFKWKGIGWYLFCFMTCNISWSGQWYRYTSYE